MAGAVPVDPWSAGLMAAGSVAGAALQKPAMTTSAQFGAVGFDNSGWTVNTGDGASQSATADRSQGINIAALLRNPLVLAALAFVAYQVLVKGK